ncbi:MAG TPA: MerR family transcriptional regulator [Thermotogota bacterium]|nr:MerR family transcriptional regulator [Thermotogota bacterium]HPJ90082.1 MerR family transcriptional regulator [Thermotogota bacterium]HPR96881.1 MerR family transcriptional regulator [Thermotogota bacterium]
MLRIGEFATLTGISIHMLRHYDQIGLLVPKQVDHTSRYRYYGEDQIITANRIQILKELGFSLRTISEMNTASDHTVRELLDEKIVEKREEAKQIEKQIRHLQRASKNLERYSELIFSVKIKSLPSRKVVFLRNNIARFDEEGLLWERLDRECTANGIIPVSGEYAYAITHNIDEKNGLIDTEVQRIISGIPVGKSGLRFSEFPETEAAVISVKGVYSRMSEISAYVYRFVQDTDYDISGVPLRKYLVSPESEPDPHQFITEYYFPLKRR